MRTYFREQQLKAIISQTLLKAHFNKSTQAYHSLFGRELLPSLWSPLRASTTRVWLCDCSPHTSRHPGSLDPSALFSNITRPNAIDSQQLRRGKRTESQCFVSIQPAVVQFSNYAKNLILLLLMVLLCTHNQFITSVISASKMSVSGYCFFSPPRSPARLGSRHPTPRCIQKLT